MGWLANARALVARYRWSHLARRVGDASVVVATGYILSTLIYFAPRVFALELNHDGVALRPALDILAGKVLFRDTVEQYGILGPYWHALILAIFGRTLWALKLYHAVLYAAMFALVYLLHRRLIGVTLALATCLLWWAFSPFATIGLQPNPIAEGLFLSLVAMNVYYYPFSQDRTRCLLVGALIGLIFGFRQTLGVYFGLALYLALFLKTFRNAAIPRRQRAIAFGRATQFLAAGFLAIITPLFLYLGWQGALQDWFTQTLYFPKVCYIQLHINGGSSDSFWKNWVEVTFYQSPSAWYWPFLVGGVLLATIWSVIGNRPLLALSLVGSALTLNTMPNGCSAHMWWSLSAFGLGAILGFLGDLFSIRPVRGLLLGFVVVLIVLPRTPITSWMMDFRSAVKSELRTLDRLRRVEPGPALTEPAILAGIRLKPAERDGLANAYRTIQSLESRYPHIVMNPDFVTPFHPLLTRNQVSPHKVWAEWPVLTDIYPEYNRYKDDLFKKGCSYFVTNSKENFPGYQPIAKLRDATFWLPTDIAQRCRAL